MQRQESPSIDDLLLLRRHEYAGERRRALNRVKYSPSPTRSFCSMDAKKQERRSPSPTGSRRRKEFARSSASLSSGVATAGAGLAAPYYSTPLRRHRHDPELIRDRYDAGYNHAYSASSTKTAPDAYAKSSRASSTGSVTSLLRGRPPMDWDDGSAIHTIQTTPVMPTSDVWYTDSSGRRNSRVTRREVSYRGIRRGTAEGESPSSWPRNSGNGRVTEMSRVEKESLARHDHAYNFADKGYSQEGGGDGFSLVDHARSSSHRDDRSTTDRSAFSEVVYLGGRGSKVHRGGGSGSVRSEHCYRDEVPIMEAATTRSARSENVKGKGDREQPLPKSSLDPVSVRRTKPNGSSASVSTFGLGTEQFPCEVLAVDTFDEHPGETYEKIAPVIQILKYDDTLPTLAKNTDTKQRTGERMSTPTRKRRVLDTASSVVSATRSEGYYRDKRDNAHTAVGPLIMGNATRYRTEKTTSSRDEKCYRDDIEIINVDMDTTDTSVSSRRRYSSTKLPVSKQSAKSNEINGGTQGKATILEDEYGQGLNPGVDIKQSLPRAITGRVVDRWSRQPRASSSTISVSGLGTEQSPCWLLDDDDEFFDEYGEAPERVDSATRMEKYETLPLLAEAEQCRDSMSTQSNLRKANDTVNSTRHVQWPSGSPEKEQKSNKRSDFISAESIPPPSVVEDQHRQDGPRNSRRGRPPKTGDLLDLNPKVAELKLHSEEDLKPRVSKKTSLQDTSGLSESTIRLLHLIRFEEERLEASRKKALKGKDPNGEIGDVDKEGIVEVKLNSAEEETPKESAKVDDASLTSDVDLHVAGGCHQQIHQQLLDYFGDDFAETLVDTHRSCSQVMNVFTLRAVEIKSVWDHIDSAREEISSTL